MVEGRNARQGILSLAIRDKNALYASYMPFVKNGGLFISTHKDYKLGEEIFLAITITLPDIKDRIAIAGKVAWITPKGAHGNKTSGIGIQFNEIDKGATKSKIEKLLAGALNSERPTNTM